MELTLVQINYLLQAAVQSPFTAEQIARLIREKRLEDIISLSRVPTMREFFSEENIGLFTDKKQLVTRLFRVVNNESGLMSFVDLPLDEAVRHPEFHRPYFWKNCGKVTANLACRMFKSQGFDVSK